MVDQADGEDDDKTIDLRELRSELEASTRRAADAEHRLREQAIALAEGEHKLKTTVAVIEGWAELLEQRWDQLSTEERQRVLGLLRQRAGDARREAERVAADARRQALAGDGARALVDLAASVAETVEVYAGIAVGCDVRYEGVTDVHGYTDPVAVRQICSHLIDNAIKYSPGGGDITVRLSSTAHQCTIEVIDSGIGLPDAIDVFALFERGAASGVVDGTGLGLHIVRNLTGNLGGEVTAVRNAGGKGSTFRVTLPLDLRVSEST